MKKVFVAINHDGVIEIHAEDSSGTYATLCGVDGDDSAVGQAPAELPKKPKITCEACKRIFLTATWYHIMDFAS